MRHGQLEINRLGSQGEVKRRIRCLAGHITVFRANDPQLLKLFANGLMGVATPGERFSVLLDNTPFNSDLHPRIGFGERFRPDDVTTVGQFLITTGVPPESVDSLLLSHGLGGLTSEACRNLSPQEDRMVRLLGIAHSEAGVVILNDPFSLVPEAWHNTFARDLSNFAWQKRAIVVVPELTARPDDWIENEIVSRIQLETPRKRTIGFGGANDDPETQRLIESLRSQVGGTTPTERAAARPPIENDLLKGSPGSHPATPEETGPSAVLRRLIGAAKGDVARLPVQGPFAILGGTFVIAMLATTAVLSLHKPEVPAGTTTAAISAPPTTSPPEPAPVASEGAASRSVLSAYPEAIAAGISLSLSDPEAALRAAQASPPSNLPSARAAAPEPSSSRLLVPSHSPIENSTQTTDEAPSEDEAELARRREEIRQRFIEAIQRQAAQQQQ